MAAQNLCWSPDTTEESWRQNTGVLAPCIGDFFRPNLKKKKIIIESLCFFFFFMHPAWGVEG